MAFGNRNRSIKVFFQANIGDGEHNEVLLNCLIPFIKLGQKATKSRKRMWDYKYVT